MARILDAEYISGLPAWYTIPVFTIEVLGSAVLLAFLRLATGLIWPAVFFHPMHNYAVIGFLDPLTLDTGSNLLISGEFGLGLMLVMVELALAAYRLGGRLEPHTQSDIMHN
jgi:hypothetical protein